MEIKILSTEKNLLDLMYVRAKTCQSEMNPIEINENLNLISDETKEKLVLSCLRAGHLTIAEIDFTVSIEGEKCTRDFGYQKARIRHQSVSQKSQKFTKNFEYTIPDEIKKDNLLQQEFIDLMEKNIRPFYQKLLDKTTKDTARSILPNCINTSFTVTQNFRSLFHEANLRLCAKASPYYREYTRLVCIEMIKLYPWLKEFLVPICIKEGYCSQPKGCGMVSNVRPPRIEYELI